MNEYSSSEKHHVDVLRKFQRDAVEKLCSTLYDPDIQALGNATSYEERVQERWSALQSCPGSGKTLMMAELIRLRMRDAIVFHISPQQGNLPEQNYAKLTHWLSDDQTFSVEKLDLHTMSLPLKRGTVFTFSWNAIYMTNTEGFPINKMTKGNHFGSFIEKIVASGIPLRIILDEAHYGHMGNFSAVENTLRSMNNIAVKAGGTAIPVVAFTATPVGKKFNTRNTVVISSKEPMKAGLLRNAAKLNNGLGKIVSLEKSASWTEKEKIVEASIAQLGVLEQTYKEAGIENVPLIGVNIPNGKKGSDLIRNMKKFLYENHGWQVGKEIAIYLENEKTFEDSREIASKNSQVRIVFYKQAITTGWDCPRLQILVAFREIASSVFAEQHIGRYMRTLLSRHFTEDDHPNYQVLNSLFIYTDDPDYRAGKSIDALKFLDDGSPYGSAYLSVKEDMKDAVERLCVTLPRFRQKNSSTPTDTTREIANIVLKSFENSKAPEIVSSSRETQGVILNKEGDLDIQRLSQGEVVLDPLLVKNIPYQQSDEEVEKNWKMLLSEVLINEGIKGTRIVDEVFDEISLRVDPTNIKRRNRLRKIMLTENRTKVSEYLSQVLSRIDRTALPQGTTTKATANIWVDNFRLPTAISGVGLDLEEDPRRVETSLYQFYGVDGKKAYRPNLSAPENCFIEKILDKTFSVNSGFTVERWQKLDDNFSDDGVYYSTVFSHNGIRNFYPDFMVWLRNNTTKSIIAIIVEVKGKNSYDGEELLNAKKSALKLLEEHVGIPGFLVRGDGNNIYNHETGRSFEYDLRDLTTTGDVRDSGIDTTPRNIIHERNWLTESLETV